MKAGKIKDGWYYCPKGHKTAQRIEVGSNLENTPVWCKHCRRAYYPVIHGGKVCVNSANNMNF